MKALITALSLTCATTGFGGAINYDFQSVPAGPLPGGFLTLNVNGVSAFFSANGTAVDTNPVTGTHALHTGNYHSQMGIELSMPITRIIVGLDGALPTTHGSVQAIAYYGLGYSLFPMTPVSSSGSTLDFNLPSDSQGVFGILLDGNGGSGYSIDYVSIQVVPEPAGIKLFVLGATTAILLGTGRAIQRSCHLARGFTSCGIDSTPQLNDRSQRTKRFRSRVRPFQAD